MSAFNTIITTIFTSSAIYALIQFLIERYDNKHDKFAEIMNKLDDMSKRIDATEEARLEDKALSYRGHIIRFNEECMRGMEHSHEAFKDVMRNMTNYDNYCNTHPEFKNHECDVSEKNIIRVYEKCMKDDNFLSH